MYCHLKMLHYENIVIHGIKSDPHPQMMHLTPVGEALHTTTMCIIYWAVKLSFFFEEGPFNPNTNKLSKNYELTTLID